jgi:hypothetical protein
VSLDVAEVAGVVPGNALQILAKTSVSLSGR